MKPLFIIFYFFCFSASMFSQQLNYELKTLDLNVLPNDPSGATLLAKAGGKAYFLTGNGLMAYDGDSLILLDENLVGDFDFQGQTDNGIFLKNVDFVPDTELYFVDHTTGAVTMVHDFESNLKAIHSFDNHVIFLDYGNRLYVSDGTVQGTQLLYLFDDPSYDIEVETQVNNLLFITDQDEVWRTDGSMSGTFPIPNLPTDAFDSPYVVSGDFVYFSQNYWTLSQRIIWRTDGTEQGTQAIYTNGVDMGISSIENIIGNGNGIFFTAETADYGREIMFCPEGDTLSHLLVDIEPGTVSGVSKSELTFNNFYPFSTEDNHILFRGGGSHSSEIWISDGTPNGTNKIIDYNGQVGFDDFDVEYYFLAKSGKGFFVVDYLPNDDGQQLWSYDPLSQMATLLIDTINIRFGDAISVGDKVYFEIDDQLYVSDGTVAGTNGLIQFIGQLNMMGGHEEKLFFTTSIGNDSLGEEPLVSDGTLAGTGLLKDLYVKPEQPYSGDSNPKDFFELNGICHFIARNNTEGLVIYQTDGTENGTVTSLDLFPHTAFSNPEYLTKAGGKLYFSIDNELWVSDGTVSGSFSLQKPFNNSTFYWGKTDERLFFVTNDSLYSTNGTIDGTHALLKEEVNEFDNHRPIQVNDELWFFYNDGINGMELYKTDGTPIGTDTLFQSLLGSETIFSPGFTSQMINFKNKVFFANSNQEVGRELWITDGTLAGTTLFSDLNEGIFSSGPKQFYLHNGKIYFSAFQNTSSTFVSDGTVTGTIKLADEACFNCDNNGVATVGNELFFVSDNDLWKTDGTPDGTVLIRTNENPPMELTALGNKVIFQMEDTNNGGIEPWISDGTFAGTHLLKNIHATGNSNPEYFTVIQDMVFFKASTPGSSLDGFGPRLWESKGGSVSTQLALPNSDDLFNPENILKFQDKIFFRATGTIVGNEIHYLDFSLPKVTVSGKIFFDENENGIADIGEHGGAGIKILTENGGEYMTYTDSIGKYEFRLPEGEYTISPSLDFCWQMSSDSSSYHFVVKDTIIENLDFGLINTPDTILTKLAIHSAATRCGFTVPFWITVANDGCDSISNVLQIQLDSLVEFVDAEIMPDSINNQILRWDSQDLGITQFKRFKINLKMPDEQSLGDTIFILGESFYWENDSLILSKDLHFQSVINCAYDPNDKRVEPDRSDLSVDNYTLFDEKMTYTIRFQNTGTDTAFTVRIIDTLSNQLDIETFQLLASSHPMKTTIYSGGVVEFLFENILLPDSIVNEPKSHGFVSFEIYPNTGLNEFDQIENTAYIYFDFNSAIVTNTISNTMLSTFDADMDGYDIWNDCDNNNAEISPGAEEIPYNDINDDCDEMTPDDDLDGDGFLLADDCDDNNFNINPNATEIANNGVDEDCDGEDLVVSAEDILLNDIEIFPNPTMDWVQLKIPDSSIAEIKIKNVTGKIIYNNSFQNQDRINLTNFGSGVYLLEVTMDKKVFIKRIIKL